MPLFEYAYDVWGDKHNETAVSSLQLLQNNAAKIILDCPLYSSASHALATLKWIPLEKRRFQLICEHVLQNKYKKMTEALLCVHFLSSWVAVITLAQARLRHATCNNKSSTQATYKSKTTGAKHRKT